ncbi:MAG TPA: agmatine deiminase family protein [Phycisphaerales bacterium]|nr:agmatine deiminase family protein [Phycisphaerales bacterium]
MAATKTPKVKRLSGTPRKLGFRFPAEWEAQSGTWFSWPRPEGISFPGKYHTVPENICRIMHAMMEHGKQAVHINVPNENYEHIVRGHLKDAKVPADLVKKYVRFHFIATNESWCRDHGPAFVVKGAGSKSSFAIVDWGFNAWGGKYPPYDSDDAVPARIAEKYAKDKRFAGIFEPMHAKAAGEQVGKLRRVVMEGGGVEFNGKGTVLTTESCLLNKNRNPALSKKQIEALLKDYYGQSHVCWLGDGIAGDDTDGHIDDLARFLDPQTIVVAREEDPKDENYALLEENVRRCSELKDQDGEPFRIIAIPMPGKVSYDGQRLPATYLNFLFVNNACLVPTFGHKTNDKLALEILQQFLPKHKVVGVDCTELIWGLGAIHCLTQQVPAVAKL